MNASVKDGKRSNREEHRKRERKENETRDFIFIFSVKLEIVMGSVDGSREEDST